MLIAIVCALLAICVRQPNGVISSRATFTPPRGDVADVFADTQSCRGGRKEDSPDHGASGSRAHAKSGRAKRHFTDVILTAVSVQVFFCLPERAWCVRLRPGAIAKQGEEIFECPSLFQMGLPKRLTPHIPRHTVGELHAPATPHGDFAHSVQNCRTRNFAVARFSPVPSTPVVPYKTPRPGSPTIHSLVRYRSATRPVPRHRLRVLPRLPSYHAFLPSHPPTIPTR